jgi:hypothetical protein
MVFGLLGDVDGGEEFREADPLGEQL